MKQIPVIILGAGGVGQALLQQIIDGRSTTITRNQIQFSVVAVADRRSLVWEPLGMSDLQIVSIIEAKRLRLPANPNPAPLPHLPGERPSNLDIIDFTLAAELENAIVVDVTAESGMEPVYDRALELGYGVVMANKKALAGPGQRLKTISTICACVTNQRWGEDSRSSLRCAPCSIPATPFTGLKGS